MRQKTTITLEVEETIIIDMLSLPELQICPACQQRMSETVMRAPEALSAGDQAKSYEKGDKDDVEDGE